MAKGGIFQMSKKEIRRVNVMEKIVEKRITQIEAAEILGISDRQVRRQVKKFRRKGIIGLVHGNRGKPGNRRYPEKERAKVLKIFHRDYRDFGPTLGSEVLLRENKLAVHHNTLRRWLLSEEDKYKWQRKERAHRKWRERRANFGEMVQMDGSHHDWLEGRGPELVLMGYVDDATGEKFGKFYLYEGTVPALDSFKEYVCTYGIPMSVYLDRHSTYKTTRKETIFEELRDDKALTQFERAMGELGVKVIHAHSAPAKGRVENMFKTFQDRLIKEMRLAKINTLDEANEFLKDYLTVYNKRFRKPAKNSGDLHRKRPSKYDLDKILCKKGTRILRKDSTIVYGKKLLLITNKISRRAREIQIEERLDGSIKLEYKDQYLSFKEIDPSIRIKQNEITYKPKTSGKTKKKSYKPSADHPWKRRSFIRYTNLRKRLTKTNNCSLVKQ